MIAIISPNTDTFTNPTMCSLFAFLQSKGEKAILFGPQQFPGCPEHIKNVELRTVDFKLTMRNPRFWLSQLKSYRKVTKAIRNYGIKTLMGVDAKGLVIAGRIKKRFFPDIRLCYLSFEIFFSDEVKGYYLSTKEEEKKYSPLIDVLLTQDEIRRELLFEENGIRLSENRVALVPVSPDDIKDASETDVRSIFGIPEGKKAVVYSGSTGKWCGTGEIISCFDKGLWPADCHLVFHSRTAPREGDEFYDDLMRLSSDPKIPFSLHPHAFESMIDLAAFLKGFDIALALYYPNYDNPYYGRNMQEIGLSSGKFSMYMMLGLPTLVTPCRIYTRLLEDYRFGATVETAQELSLALQKNYDKAEARRLYEQILTPRWTEYEKMFDNNGLLQ
ncbi:MAG: hypothetical protein IJU69_02715 [Bacteroidales bacterium]|nr:hypothetical protein [Bacteroidales bacterium]